MRTGADFRDARKALGHSQESLAKLLRVQVRTIHRWEQATSLTPVQSLAMTALQEGHRPPSRPRRTRKS